jgi:hypothetical protein
MKTFSVSLFISLFLISCSSDYSPKPSGYFHIEFAEHNYRSLTDYQEFEFNIPIQVEVIEIPDTDKGKWFNLVYPQLNAQIYCSYFPITKATLEQVSEESRKFVNRHTLKAEAIQEHIFEDSELKVYGLVYRLKGGLVSPVQFILTDSVNSFFRGALYFNDVPNQDSIAPVLKYINEDIQVIIESFRWKK